MNGKILIAEDNVEISDMLRNYLIRSGHTVYQAFDGGQAMELFRAINPDLILLDIMMPVLDGYEVCEAVRRIANVPIIIVSAVTTENEKLRMFDLGADDYVTKPFSFKETVSRVNAQLRRYYEFSRPNTGDRNMGKLAISPERYEAKIDGVVLNLTAKEFKLLEVLTATPNMIYPKQKLIDEVWGIDEYIEENTLAVTVARLRDKLAKYGVTNVVTVWGLGYKWQD